MSDATELVELPLPTIFKPRKLWTGKQVMSLLVRPNRDAKSFVNVECEEKFYKEVGRSRSRSLGFKF